MIRPSRGLRGLVAAAGVLVFAAATGLPAYAAPVPTPAAASPTTTQPTTQPTSTTPIAGPATGQPGDRPGAGQPAVPEPRLEVSRTTGVRPGDELTVRGSGFDPAANPSTRVPVTPGQPAGVYVVFGSFAESWRPSAGADAGSRTLLDTKWALPQSSRDQVTRDFPNQAPRLVPLNADGTFELVLKAKEAAENPRRYGVYTYPGGSAVNAAHELAVPVTFAGDGSDPDPGGPPPNTLDWGVKASFRTYIEGNIAHGKIALADPATRNADGTFRFPGGSGTAQQVGFAGGVRFTGHELQAGNPLLEMSVSDVRVRLSGSSGKVVADVVSKSLENGQRLTYDDVELADLDLTAHPVVVTDGVATVTGAPAKLTEAGVPAFANFYTAGTALDPVSFSVQLSTDPGWTPELALFGADGNKLGTVPAAGATVTVRGRGFDPAANPSTRPPVTPGRPAGVYVVFGSFDQTWQPSQGAASATRRVQDQKWALPDESRPGADPAYVTLRPDGTFETTLTVKPADIATGTYGVATYAAGGAAPNATQELLVPVTFGSTGEPALTVDPATGLADGQAVAVRGTGFAPNRALYVAQTPQGTSGTSNPSPFAGAQRVVTSAAGTFTATVEVAVTFTNEGVDVDCRAVACHLAGFSSPLDSDNAVVDLRDDRSQDVFRAIAFRDAGPQPVLPAVTRAPEATTVTAGGTATFTAAATGTPAPAVQWERSTDEGKNWAPVASPSAVTPTLSLPAVTEADNGARFRAVFSNTSGSATSAAAVLTVRPAADPAVRVSPGTVAPGAELLIEGTGFPAGQKVTATVDADPVPGVPEYAFRNASGQSVVLSPVGGASLKVANGKLVVPDGAQVAARIGGLANGKANTAAAPSGFYLLTAVDNGPGRQASPAIGGVDLTGASGTSQWITNFPYAGSEEQVVPIGTDLAARTSVLVKSADEHTRCADAPNGCVLYLRADHRSTGNRAFDVRIPLQFAAPDAEQQAGGLQRQVAAEADAVRQAGTSVGEQTAAADGAVSFRWTVPAGFAAGKHTVTLSAGDGVVASGTFAVQASSSPTPSPTPTTSPTADPTTPPGGGGGDGAGSPPTGSNQPPVEDSATSPAGALASTGGAAFWLPVAGGLLLVAGAVLVLTTRRRRAAA